MKMFYNLGPCSLLPTFSTPIVPPRKHYVNKSMPVRTPFNPPLFYRGDWGLQGYTLFLLFFVQTLIVGAC